MDNATKILNNFSAFEWNGLSENNAFLTNSNISINNELITNINEREKNEWKDGFTL